VAALAATIPTLAGTTSTGAAVAASDTIAQSVMGPNGATLEIINNGAGTDTITISDNGLTPGGNALPSNTYTVTVANAGASKVFKLTNAQVNPSTNLITITHTVTASVTYKLYPVG